jgi:hypothetical protein
MIPSFSFGWRNYGHWDVCNGKTRIFRIRGGPGEYRVIDERPEGVRKPMKDFKTLGAAVSYITDELMFELIVAEGQTPVIIESWNVSS